MFVIVGLGNPGSQYAGTRHNIGFDVIDSLAGSPSVGPFREKFDAMVAESREGPEGQTLMYVKPMTFMNLSGRAVRAIVDFYKVDFAKLLVVCDDFNLPLGKLRIRQNGTAGGQNGLKNIQLLLGTDAYPRMRLGVGAPQHENAVDHVLGKWKPGERSSVDEMIAKAAQAVTTFVRQGAEASMNRFNSGDDPKPKKPPRSKDPSGPTNQVAPPAAAGGPEPTGSADPR
jgi:peptidyl-tRNA hydrolase, PTH1 family